MISQLFKYNGIDYVPGDEISVDGFPGTWIIKEFCRNSRSTNGEWYASLVDGKRRLFWPAHELNKV